MNLELHNFELNLNDLIVTSGLKPGEVYYILKLVTEDVYKAYMQAINMEHQNLAAQQEQENQEEVGQE